MPRKSACSNTVSEIKNSGLRPNWDHFWELDAAWRSESDTGAPLACSSSSSQVRPPLYHSSSAAESESSIQQVHFVTGSLWIGVWDKLGMNGMGMYQLPNGVVYHGHMSGGVCDGNGLLMFPNGGMLEGVWQNGKLKSSEYVFADKLVYGGPKWHYCKMPDRRFFLEQKDGLRPASSEQLTAGDLARVVPPGMFDVGDGLYSPKTKCVTDPLTGEVLRIPPATEESWIVKHARTAELKTAGFCPQFYENLFRKTVSTPGERAVVEEPDQELLRVVQQEGYELEPPPKDKILDQTHNLRLKDPKRKLSSSSSKSSESSEMFSDLIKNMDLKKSTSGTSLNGSVEQSAEEYGRIGSKELSLYRLLHDVGFKVSGRMEQLLLQDGASQLVESTDSTMKRSHTFSSTKSNLDVLRALTRILISVSSKNTLPFTISSSDFSPMNTPLKISQPTSELTFDHPTTKDSSNVFSEYMGSTENFSIDYLEFASTHDLSD